VEVQSCEVLDALVKEIGSSYGYNYYLIPGTDTSTGQNVGLLTRVDPNIPLARTEDRVTYPVEGSNCGYYGTKSTTGVSKHYYTNFLINDEVVWMFGAHLVAIPNDPMRCSQREGQAEVLAHLIQSKVSAGEHAIVLGDLNDYDSDVCDSQCDKPNSRVLSFLKTSLNPNFLTVMAMVPDVSARYSDWYNAKGNCENNPVDRSAIDHLLVTPELQPRIFQVNYLHNYNIGCDTIISDHWPIVVGMNWPSSKGRPAPIMGATAPTNPTSNDVVVFSIVGVAAFFAIVASIGFFMYRRSLANRGISVPSSIELQSTEP